MLQQAPNIAVIVALLAAGVATLVLTLKRATKSDLSVIKAEAISQFEKWLASNAASQLGLNRENFQVVQESETIGQDRSGLIYSYTLTRFLRGVDGQYVMFKSTPRGPYVKVVAPSVAKAVLKERYVPPSAG